MTLKSYGLLCLNMEMFGKGKYNGQYHESRSWSPAGEELLVEKDWREKSTDPFADHSLLLQQPLQ